MNVSHFRPLLTYLERKGETECWLVCTWAGQMLPSWWGRQPFMYGKWWSPTLPKLWERSCLHCSRSSLVTLPPPAMTNDRYCMQIIYLYTSLTSPSLGGNSNKVSTYISPRVFFHIFASQPLWETKPISIIPPWTRLIAQCRPVISAAGSTCRAGLSLLHHYYLILFLVLEPISWSEQRHGKLTQGWISVMHSVFSVHVCHTQPFSFAPFRMYLTLSSHCSSISFVIFPLALYLYHEM